MHRFVHDHRAQRGAALPRGAEAGEQSALHRQVEIGTGGDHQRVLAAEFQARGLQVAAGQRADLPAHGRRAGEPNLVDQAVAQGRLQTGEGGLAVGLHQVQHPVGQPTAAHEELEQGGGRGRGILRRLPDHRVPRQQGGHEVPRRDGDREIPGGDHGDSAHRLAEGEQLLVGHLARHRLPVQPPALAEEEVAGVDDLPDLTESLGVRLADLPGHQAGQRLGVVLDQPADGRDRPAADGRRHRGPLRLRLAGRGSRRHECRGVPEFDLGDEIIQIGGIGAAINTHETNSRARLPTVTLKRVTTRPRAATASSISSSRTESAGRKRSERGPQPRARTCSDSRSSVRT